MYQKSYYEEQKDLQEDTCMVTINVNFLGEFIVHVYVFNANTIVLHVCCEEQRKHKEVNNH
jgi:hypothetical protein